MFGWISYTVFMSIFCWLPLLLIWIKHHKRLLQYKDIFKRVLLISIPLYLVWDNLEVYFLAWRFNSEKIFGIYLPYSPIESLLFTITVVLIISSVTVLLYEKRKKSKME